MEIEKLVRKNILELLPYSCARDEYDGPEATFLDANENPFENGFNRYPDPYQRELKKVLSTLKKVRPENMILGNGSDEIIDLLIRSFCELGEDNILVFSPGYSMYEVSAAINRVEVKKLNLTPEFLPDWEEMRARLTCRTKLVFLCTPNNPTGKVIPLDQIAEFCADFEGLVVVDEAYIDFTPKPSAITLLDRFPNVVVMQTLSKAWGMAGLRLGIGIACEEVVKILNKVKAPYNISSLTQTTVLGMLREYTAFRQKCEAIIKERERLLQELRKMDLFREVYDSEANFILVTIDSCRDLYRYLTERKIVVRLRDILPLIPGGIRITIGMREENEQLLEALSDYKKQIEK